MTRRVSDVTPINRELLVEAFGQVRLVTLNRPGSLNAITPSMESAYYGLLGSLDADPNVRVIVVTGAGRGFCSGADISGSSAELVDGGPPLPDRRTACYPPTMRTPLIAAINGVCFGLGLAIALQADIRFIAADAKIASAFTRRGLIAEHGVAWALPRIVGRGRASDLLISGRTISGEQAAEYGIAEFCTTADLVKDEALTYAQDIAKNCSPRAASLVKAQIELSDLLGAFDGLLSADHYTRESFCWPDVIEGVNAWQERRSPSFPNFS